MRLSSAWVLMALLVVSCKAEKFNFAGAPCTDAGECIADYSCYDDGTALTCVTTGDGCPSAGEQSPCTFGETTCDNGCRTCTDDGAGTLQWSDCEIPVVGDECVPDSATCDMSGSLVTCTSNGFIDTVTPCGPPGCNDAVATPRCNDCIPSVNFCDNLEFVTCTLEGLEGSRTDCATANQCAGAGACNASSGCSILMTAPDGTACDEGPAMDGDFCNSSCVSGVCTAATPAVCDDMDPCTDDVCSMTMGCQFTNSMAGSPCPGTDTDWCTSTCDGFGTCDDMTPLDCDDMEGCTNDSCNGGLCSNTAANPGMTCRPVAGPCDVEEQCDGMNPSCPANTFVTAMSMTSCRARGMMEPCDIEEFCDGMGAACPMDAVEPGMDTVSCRGVMGPCDIEEFCDGTNKTCPLDAVQPGPGTMSCRGVMGNCDIEDFCDGSTVNCPDVVAAGGSTVSCRAPGVGEVCDIEEFCDGTNPVCPPVDAVEAGGMTVQCRMGGDACDPAEFCDGMAKTCPMDIALADGVQCAVACGGVGGTELTETWCLGGTCSDVQIPMQCDDMLGCNGADTCDAMLGCQTAAPPCVDGCGCSADNCMEPASCDFDFTACNSIVITGATMANARQLVTLTVDIGCAGESGQLVCTGSQERYCLAGTDFEGTMGGWQDGGAFGSTNGAPTNVNCNANTGQIPTTGCTNNDGGGDVMRIPRDRRAELAAAIDATGYTDLRINFDAAISDETEGSGGSVDFFWLRACCGSAAVGAGSSACANSAGNDIDEIESSDGAGQDGWGDRPCIGGCSGAGYTLPTGPYGGSPCGGTSGCQYDDCPSLLVGFENDATANDEMVMVDDLYVSGIGTPTFPVTDNGDGTYSFDVWACEATTVDVDCTWTPTSGGSRSNVPGAQSAMHSVQFN